MAKSIRETVLDVADYIETQMRSGAFDIVPGIHQSVEDKREAGATFTA